MANPLMQTLEKKLCSAKKFEIFRDWVERKFEAFERRETKVRWGINAPVTTAATITWETNYMKSS
jgi:hypothetical protein